MFFKLALFALLAFICMISVYGEEETCNYLELREFFFFFIGLFPGQYAENYCISVGSQDRSLKFVCDSSGVGWLEGYGDDECQTFLNSSRLNTTEYVCDATDECSLYTIDYSTYNDSSDCTGTEPIFNQFTQFVVEDGCFDLTIFGFETGVTASTDIDSDGYTLTLYNGTTPCTGLSFSLDIYAGCNGNDTTQQSYNLDITSDGSGGSGSSAVFYGDNILVSYLFIFMAFLSCFLLH